MSTQGHSVATSAPSQRQHCSHKSERTALLTHCNAAASYHCLTASEINSPLCSLPPACSKHPLCSLPPARSEEGSCALPSAQNWQHMSQSHEMPVCPPPSTPPNIPALTDALRGPPVRGLRRWSKLTKL